MISVIDYGAGNIASVMRSIEHLGYDAEVISSPSEFPTDTTTVLLPGVGDGAFMMKELNERDFSKLLRQWAKEDRPMLGICVGAQVLLSFTEEGEADCLDVIAGKCKAFEPRIDETLKIPQIGWNTIMPQIIAASRPMIFEGIPDEASMYFVHSYYLSVEDRAHALALTDYGVQFASVIGTGNIMGTQFHPEKSGRWGLRLIDNFLHFYGKEERNRI